MAEEKALFEALAKASYHVDTGKLIIADKNGRGILRFNAACTDDSAFRPAYTAFASGESECHA